MTGISQVRVNGDIAHVRRASTRCCSNAKKSSSRHRVRSPSSLRRTATALKRSGDAWRALEWSTIEYQSGLTRIEIEGFVDDVMSAKSVVVCWAMGLTQHRNSVATIREIVNFLLLRGNIGRRGAGPSPIRGHSNVQGDRTMGIWEKMPDSFLDKLRDEFGFDPPREHGLDTVNTLRAMRDGKIGVFFALGGNFVSATPDTELTAVGDNQL